VHALLFQNSLTRVALSEVKSFTICMCVSLVIIKFSACIAGGGGGSGDLASVFFKFNNTAV